MANEKIIQIISDGHALVALTNFGKIYEQFGNGYTYERKWREVNLPELHKTKPKKTGKKSFGIAGLVQMTEEEHGKLIDNYGKELIEKMIANLEDYINRTGKEYKDHYFTIIKWIDNDRNKNPQGTYKQGTYRGESGSTRREL